MSDYTPQPESRDPFFHLKKNKRVGQCPWCLHLFVKVRAEQVYCSARCAATEFKIAHGLEDKGRARNRYHIYSRDGYQCAYCGRSSFGDRVELTLDHVIPKADGGGDTADNLITACRECNSAKNMRPVPSTEVHRLLDEIRVRNESARIQGATPISLRGMPKWIEERNAKQE